MDRSIRFITSRYEDKFKIPDGGVIGVTYPDRKFSMKCEYVDSYHMRLGSDVLHICQFAELLEHGGGECKPEEVLKENEAAWDIGNKGFLAIQTCDTGYDYTLYDHDFNEIDGGQIDDEDSSINAIRNEILQDFGWDKQSMTLVDYEDLMEQVEEKQEEPFSAKRESALETLHGLNGHGKENPSGRHKTEVER
ncbi:MAG: hypothetical protein Q4B26_06040 [Eubacteriales bacterium]|nr:hypothetical protein [Eubacteriales bacterium]